MGSHNKGGKPLYSGTLPGCLEKKQGQTGRTEPLRPRPGQVSNRPGERKENRLFPWDAGPWTINSPWELLFLVKSKKIIFIIIRGPQLSVTHRSFQTTLSLSHFSLTISSIGRPNKRTKSLTNLVVIISHWKIKKTVSFNYVMGWAKSFKKAKGSLRL